ncbi:MAG: hypothetical protein SGPRY_006632 [Prymnesium sp.]
MLMESSLFAAMRRDVVYLNGASRSALPDPTVEVGLFALRRKAETPWEIGDTTQIAQEIRQLFAQLVGEGVAAEDIFLTPSCSYAISLAARNLRSRLTSRRTRVLVLEDQMHSNVLPWQQLCDEHGGELLMIKRPANWDWTSAIESAIAGGEVAICALPPCHWCDGSLVNLDRVGAACRKGDVALVIDGTQWIGAAPTIDAATLGACFVACSVHKWLLGPYGCCLCYAPRSFWKDAHPIEHHDRNREGAQHVECLPMDDSGRYPSEFMNGARRLDSGGRPSYIIMPMIRESLNILVKQLTVPRVTAELRRYTTELARRAKELGFHVPPHHAPNIVGLWPAAGMPAADEIVRALAEPPVPVLLDYARSKGGGGVA